MKMQYKKSTHLLLLVIFGIFVAGHTASAEVGCVLEPFTTTITQGGSATVSVTIALPDASASYELNLGNMPLSVEGGFVQVSDQSGGSVKKVSLLIAPKSDAQTGSFMIPILCRIVVGGNTSESINQFNLVVNKATKSVSYIANTQTPSAASQTLSSSAGGIATTSALKESFDLSVKKAAEEKVAAKGRIISSMQRGSRGAQVSLLQEILQKLKFFPASQAPTGYFGPITEGAVKAFQKSKNIESIGIVGPKTRKALLEISQ